MPDANDRPDLETAASLAIRNVPMLDGTLSAGAVRAELRTKASESIEAILVLHATSGYDGAAAFLGIWAWFQDVNLAFGVGVALFAASSIASVLGLILPWLLARAGVDPAFGSGPVATILQDVLTIAIYFLVMTTVISL